MVNALGLVSVFESSVILVRVDPVEFRGVLGYGAHKTLSLGTGRVVEIESREWVTIFKNAMTFVDSVEIKLKGKLVRHTSAENREN